MARTGGKPSLGGLLQGIFGGAREEVDQDRFRENQRAWVEQQQRLELLWQEQQAAFNRTQEYKTELFRLKKQPVTAAANIQDAYFQVYTQMSADHAALNAQRYQEKLPPIPPPTIADLGVDPKTDLFKDLISMGVPPASAASVRRGDYAEERQGTLLNNRRMQTIEKHQKDYFDLIKKEAENGVGIEEAIKNAQAIAGNAAELTLGLGSKPLPAKDRLRISPQAEQEFDTMYRYIVAQARQEGKTVPDAVAIANRGIGAVGRYSRDRQALDMEEPVRGGGRER